MNRPNVKYDPKAQNRLASSIDFSNSSNSSPLTDAEKQKAKLMRSQQYANKQFGKSSINSSFVPENEVKKLQQRVYACRQSMGASNISFNYETEVPESTNSEDEKVKEQTSPVQRVKKFNETTICLSPEGEKSEKPRARVHPGNSKMLHENLNEPVSKGGGLFSKHPSRIGEEHLDQQLVPPPYEQLEYITRIGEEHLDKQLCPPEVPKSTRTTKMCDESDPNQSIKVIPKANKTPWIESTMNKPLESSKPRREYPNNQSLGHENRNVMKEWEHPKLKSEYPEGHQFGKSNIGSNLGQSEIIKPKRRGSYEHHQAFNAESEIPKVQRRPSRMGESNLTLG